MTREEKLAILIYDSVWTEENESVFVEKVKSAITNFLDNENPWHKVSEELPKENTTVLGIGISGYHYVCRYMYGHWYSESNLTARITITHWMPIPEIKED